MYVFAGNDMFYIDARTPEEAAERIDRSYFTNRPAETLTVHSHQGVDRFVPSPPPRHRRAR
jgi:hypothetical protein